MRRFLVRATWVTMIALFVAGLAAISFGFGCPCNLAQGIALIYLGFLMWLAGALIAAVSLIIQLIFPDRSS